jgi:hypothetical protein
MVVFRCICSLLTRLALGNLIIQFFFKIELQDQNDAIWVRQS